jgi:uncharacterized damage-inducible protein DinB
MLLSATPPSKNFDEFSNEFLLDVYAQGPERLRSAVANLNEDELTVFPFKDKWSIKEIAFHILDSELVGSIRFRQTITQSDTVFPFYNQDIWTKELEYQQRDIYELQDALEMFRLLRLSNSRLLKSVKEDQWDLKGFHPERGELSLRQLLEIYADHCERHIDQILARRRLFGKPFDLRIILNKRL